MLIKLTYLNNGNPTLVDLNSISEAYTVYEQGRGLSITKIVKKDGKFLNVLETPQQIMQMQMEVMNGTYNPSEDNYEQVPVPTMPIDERITSSYDRPQYRQKRYDNYNNRNAYNENSY